MLIMLEEEILSKVELIQQSGEAELERQGLDVKTMPTIEYDVMDSKALF